MKYKPYDPKKGYRFTPETDKINYLAKTAAQLDKAHAPADRAWAFKALAALPR